MPNKKTLLDVGCGKAMEAIRFARKGFHVFGVEKGRAVLDVAKENVEKFNQEKNITLINKDIRHANLKTKFDLVIFSYVLMFMSKEEADKLVEKYYKKLKNGGEIIIRVLMSDDKLAKVMEKKGKGKSFFPTKSELRVLSDKFDAKPIFKTIHDKPHDTMKRAHVHSTGHVKIKRRNPING